MKLLKIHPFYPEYLDSFLGKNPDFKALSYSEQTKKLYADAFSWSDFLPRELSLLGYEVEQYIFNFEELQKTWAKENHVSYREKHWMLDIAKAQILKFKPEILFLADYSACNSNWLLEIKKECPSIRLTLRWCGAPFDHPSIFKGTDLVLSNTYEIIDELKQIGVDAIHMNHAFSKEVLDRLDCDLPQSTDFSFVGSIVRNNRFHLKREKILEAIVREIPISIYTKCDYRIPSESVKFLLKTGTYYLFQRANRLGFPKPLLKKIPKLGKAVDWVSPPKFPISLKLYPRFRPPVFGLEMYQTLRNSKATFNNHIDISSHSANNQRLYEATGVGTCLVTDWKENLPDLFDTEKEVVTYRTAEECVSKVKWLLEHPKEREKIAKAGQEKTLKDHTWKARAEQLDGILRARLKQPRRNPGARKVSEASGSV